MNEWSNSHIPNASLADERYAWYYSQLGHSQLQLDCFEMIQNNQGLARIKLVAWQASNNEEITH